MLIWVFSRLDTVNRVWFLRVFLYPVAMLNLHGFRLRLFSFPLSRFRFPILGFLFGRPFLDYFFPVLVSFFGFHLLPSTFAFPL